MFNKIFPYNYGIKIPGYLWDETLRPWFIPQANTIENRIFVFAKHDNHFFSGSIKYITPLYSSSNFKTIKKYITYEKINTQLKDFLKNYNTDKVLNNYKVFNTNQNYKLFQESNFFIKKAKTQFILRPNKAILNKPVSRNEEAQNSSAARLKKKLKNVLGPVLNFDILVTNTSVLDKKLGRLEDGFLKKPAFRRADFNFTVFQQKANKPQSNMTVLTKNHKTRKKKSKAKNFFDKTQIRQTTYNNSASFLLKPQALSCHAVLRTSKIKKIRQPNVNNSKHVSLKIRADLSYKRTYYFLQSLLTKYLETKPVNINYKSKDQNHLEKKERGNSFLTLLFKKTDKKNIDKSNLLKNKFCSSARFTLPFRTNSNSRGEDFVSSILSKAPILKKATAEQKEAEKHKGFIPKPVFNQNNYNKTFLTYWLIPITGFAFTLMNNTGFTLFNDINHSLLPNQAFKFELLNSNNKNNFLQITTTFNNLYLQMLYKANSYNTLLNNVLHKTRSSDFALQNSAKPLDKSANVLSSSKMFYTISKSFSNSSLCQWTTNLLYLNDNSIYNKKQYNLDNCFLQGSNKVIFSQKIEQTACLRFTPLKNLFYLQTKDSFVIQPLNKLQVLNNYLNFIKSKESLNLLKIKIIKLKKFYVKTAKIFKEKLDSKYNFVTPFTSFNKGCKAEIFISAGTNKLKKSAAAGCKAITCLNDIQRLILKKQLRFTGNKINVHVEKTFLSLQLKNVLKTPVANKTKFLSYFIEKNKNKISKKVFQYKASQLQQVPKLITKAVKQVKPVDYFILVKNPTQDRSFITRPASVKKIKNSCFAFFIYKNTTNLKHRLFSDCLNMQLLSEEEQLKSGLNIYPSKKKIYTAKNESDYFLINLKPQKTLKIFNTLQDKLKTKKQRYFFKTGQKKKNNVLSISFEHQKMFKKNTENFKNLIQNQKKRRAKKQKLETRRQKKRTRFFPRPIWLRNRLFLNFLNKRKLTSFNQLSTDNKNKMCLFFKQEPNLFIKQLFFNLLATSKNQVHFYRLKFPKIFAPASNAITRVLKIPRYKASILKNLSSLAADPVFGTSLKNKILRFLLEIKKNKVMSANKTSFLHKLDWPSSEYNMGNYFFSQTYKHIFINSSINQQSFLKTEKNRQTKLHNLKTNKNYFNFNEEKTNNTQVNQKQKNIPYINFWIWAYNSTTDNNKPFFIWLLPPSVIKPVQSLNVKINPKQNLFKKHRTILRIHWALNKTNTNTITDYSKRYNLWATQKLRNQSKNNKTKSLEKQFITNWTTLKLFPIYNASHFQLIKKKSQNYKKLSLFSKKIKTKLREKKQKLDYLTTIFFNNKSITGCDKTSSKLKEFKMFKNGNLNTIFNHYPITPSQQLKSSFAALNIIKANTTLKKDYFLMSCCMLLHLCTLITLVSISQVRCFIKFHLILLTKLSNLYSTLIQNIVKKLLINFNFIKTGNILLPTNTKSTTFYNLQSILPADYLSTALQKKVIAKEKSQLLNQRPVFALLQSTFRKNYLKLKQRKLFFYSLPAALFSDSLKISRVLPKKNRQSFFIKNKDINNNINKKAVLFFNKISGTARFLFKSALIKYKNSARWSSLKKQHVQIFYEEKKTRQVDKTRAQAFSKEFFAKKKSNTYFNIFSKFNIVKSYINLINLKIIDLFPNSKATLKNRADAKNFKFKYKINQSIFLIKQRINGFVKYYKNKILRLVFKVINIFQTIVRTISTFFEKPAEFTTTWIAFGFLVEWSSDLITIIPENIDSYIWSTFSKTVRIIPIKLFFDLNIEALMISNLSKNVLIDSFLGVSVNKILDITPISLLESPINSNITAFGLNKAASAVLLKNNWQNFLILTVSHLLQRRILFLFSRLKDTLNIPDADLILRQQKGTLFWDIWADFLVTAAEYYNVNVAALSAIKTEQNTLIEKLSKAPVSLWFDQEFVQNTNFNLQQQFDNKKKTTLVKKSLRKYNWLNFFLINNSGSALNLYKTGKPKLPTVMQQKKIACGITQKLASNIQQSKMLYRLFLLQHLSNNNKSKKYFKSKKINKDQELAEEFLKQKFLFQQGNIADRWSVNQFITSQTYKNFNKPSADSNSDLFIDFHTPKAFLHIPMVKYNNILQQPIGILVCQIYSGLFTKQNAKNILLVKKQSTDSSVLLIQALAGETELKIITDNAQRYALVNRGFAIGIKLLRDVFFAIALNTPCIFLLEDLHAIGERRPMLISDFGEQHEGSFAKTSNFITTGKQEVHEKNQVVYQLTRHKITDYKKPFKGDYSLTIPTNLYSLDLFLKSPTLASGRSTSNLSLISNNNLTLKNKINLTKENKKSSVHTQEHKVQTGFITGKRMKNNYLKPPSTSPFSLLLLKEEKKLKPNKIVEDISWAGLPYRVDETKLRTSYSVRAKVAMLAELSLSNISAKLDMLTDLLVIIDSVRSNKGFVVFATTNLPHILDPALRRPGRFDETICLQASHGSSFETSHPTFLSLNTKQTKKSGVAEVSLWETMEIKKSIIKKGRQAILIKKLFSEQQETHPLFAQAITSFRLPASISLDLINKKIGNFILPSALNLTVNFKDFDTILTLKTLASREHMLVPQENFNNNTCLNTNLSNSQTALISYTKKLKHKKSKILIKQRINLVATGKLTTQETNLICFSKAIAYYGVGKIMLTYYLNKCDIFDFNIPKQSPKALSLNFKSMNFLSLFGLKNKIILQLMYIFGGKISQYLSQPPNNSKVALVYANFLKNGTAPQRLYNMYNFDGNNKSIHPVNEQKLLKYLPDVHPQKTLNKQTILEIFDGTDNSIKLATSLMLSFIHKRYLYLKNLIVPKLLSFTDGMILEEPPSPPFSMLLIPAKRFENYKRVFHDSFVGAKQGQRKGQISLIEKQTYYTQLNKIKELNKTFAQHSTNAGKFINKPTAVSPLENGLCFFTTNINWYYQNIILKRHGQYLTNQWWNGQLSEHNPETVFLSDIDWRSSFIKKPSQKKKKPLQQQVPASGEKRFSSSFKNWQVDFDILLDFPDTEQYYNPHRRRWLLNKGYWSFWFNFDKVYSEEIVTTWVLESIIQTYLYLHKNTEFLDYVVSKFIGIGLSLSVSIGETKTPSVFDFSKTEISSIKEILFTTSFKRFN